MTTTNNTINTEPLQVGRAPPQKQIEDNNNRCLHMKCKASQEDLAIVAAQFGERSAEYKAKLAWAYTWIGSDLPDILALAIADLAARGHGKVLPGLKQYDRDELHQTIRTAESSVPQLQAAGQPLPLQTGDPSKI